MRRLSFLTERAEPSLKGEIPSDVDHFRMAEEIADLIMKGRTPREIAAHVERAYPRADWDFPMVGVAAEDFISDKKGGGDAIDTHHETMPLIVKALGPKGDSGEQFGGFGL